MHGTVFDREKRFVSILGFSSFFCETYEREKEKERERERSAGREGGTKAANQQHQRRRRRGRGAVQTTQLGTVLLSFYSSVMYEQPPRQPRDRGCQEPKQHGGPKKRGGGTTIDIEGDGGGVFFERGSSQENPSLFFWWGCVEGFYMNAALKPLPATAPAWYSAPATTGAGAWWGACCCCTGA